MNCKSLLISCFLSVSLLFSFKQASSQDKNWTHFRGSNLNGIAATENIPLNWDETTVKWKTLIHDKGHSSPVIFNDQIWLTTSKPDGKELYAICADFQTGQIIYDIKVFTPEVVEGKNSINTYASPTPCIEKGYVYVHFGNMGTACINTNNGKIVWTRTDLKCKHVQGPGSSLVLYKNLLIVHMEGVDERYIVALDKSNGKTVWRTDRPAEPYKALAQIGRKAYITPLILNVKGHDIMISNGSAICQALDPQTGKEIWNIIGGAESTASMPVSEKGIVFWYNGFVIDSTGFKYTEMLAVNPDGKGDIAGTNIIWRRRDELSENQCLTPVIKDGLIYTLTTRGNMMCIDAADGKEVWSTHVTANYSSSPIYLNGNIWFFSVKGDVVVIKAGRKYEVVSQFKMDSGIWATPAFLRNSVILRTQNYLCRISK